jgi:hypothetical protein
MMLFTLLISGILCRNVTNIFHTYNELVKLKLNTVNSPFADASKGQTVPATRAGVPSCLGLFRRLEIQSQPLLVCTASFANGVQGVVFLGLLGEAKQPVTVKFRLEMVFDLKFELNALEKLRNAEYAVKFLGLLEGVSPIMFAIKNHDQLHELNFHFPAIVMDFVHGISVGDWLQTDHTKSELDLILSQLILGALEMYNRGLNNQDSHLGNALVCEKSLRVTWIDMGMVFDAQNDMSNLYNMLFSTNKGFISRFEVLISSNGLFIDDLPLASALLDELFN